MQTSSNFVYDEFNANNFNYIYKFYTLVELYKHKHLMTVPDNDHDTGYKQITDIQLLKWNKVFCQKSVLYRFNVLYRL